jgi:hypothetical protein
MNDDKLSNKDIIFKTLPVPLTVLPTPECETGREGDLSLLGTSFSMENETITAKLTDRPSGGVENGPHCFVNRPASAIISLLRHTPEISCDNGELFVKRTK